MATRSVGKERSPWTRVWRQFKLRKHPPVCTASLDTGLHRAPMSRRRQSTLVCQHASLCPLKQVRKEYGQCFRQTYCCGGLPTESSHSSAKTSTTRTSARYSSGTQVGPPSEAQRLLPVGGVNTTTPGVCEMALMWFQNTASLLETSHIVGSSHRTVALIRFIDVVDLKMFYCVPRNG